jgi:hypothetical protein
MTMSTLMAHLVLSWCRHLLFVILISSPPLSPARSLSLRLSLEKHAWSPRYAYNGDGPDDLSFEEGDVIVLADEAEQTQLESGTKGGSLRRTLKMLTM